MLNIIFNDWVLSTVLILILSAIGILIFLLYKWKMITSNGIDNDIKDNEDILQEDEDISINQNSSILDAQLEEIKSQILLISNRLSGIENLIQEKKEIIDKNIDINLIKTDIEQTLKKIEEKTEQQNYIPSEWSELLKRIEAKIEGIHKLLIILTNSGDPDQR